MCFTLYPKGKFASWDTTNFSLKSYHLLAHLIFLVPAKWLHLPEPYMNLLLKVPLLVVLVTSCQTVKNHDKGVYINSVQGRLPLEQLHFVLTHEHIMSNFGAEPTYTPTYDKASLYNQVIPYLRKVKTLGISTVFDCTAAYFGRDVLTLKAFSDSTGINIITNTGFYGAANDRYVPELAYTLSEKEIAAIWIREFTDGIDQTGIKPGFIKLAFDSGAPSEIDLKLFRAGILTHLATGLTLMVHTGNNSAAGRKQLELLVNQKVSPSAWVWAHANQSEDMNVLLEAATKGAWISLDGVKESNVAEYIDKIGAFKIKGLLHRVLLSHDGNSFPRGGAIRAYDAISTSLLPRLKEEGYSAADIDQLMVKNPQMAFGIRVRPLESYPIQGK